MLHTSLTIVTSSPTKSGAGLLLRAAQNLGYDASLVIATEPDAAASINASDKVIFRMSPSLHSLYSSLQANLEGAAKTTLQSVLNAFDKAATYEILKRNNVPTPESYIVDHDGSVKTYPAVVKILNGNQGIGVQLLKNDVDLQTFKKEFSAEKVFLIQEFIEESSGVDTRLFIVGDSCVAAMKRTSQTDDFRANLHLGATVEPYDPTEKEVEKAVAAAKAFNLPFAGVDIIDSKRGPLVLEVNPSPGFGIQNVAATDLPNEVIKGVMND